MKKMRKSFLILMCIGMMAMFAACGSNDTADGTNGTVNDATNGTTDNMYNDDNNTADDTGNVVDDVVDGVGNGVNDVVDGVEDGVDDITDDQAGNSTTADQKNSKMQVKASFP